MSYVLLSISSPRCEYPRSLAHLVSRSVHAIYAGGLLRILPPWWHLRVRAHEFARWPATEPCTTSVALLCRCHLWLVANPQRKEGFPQPRQSLHSNPGTACAGLECTAQILTWFIGHHLSRKDNPSTDVCGDGPPRKAPRTTRYRKATATQAA